MHPIGYLHMITLFDGSIALRLPVSVRLILASKLYGVTGGIDSKIASCQPVLMCTDRVKQRVN
jgi:hypothetical protein